MKPTVLLLMPTTTYRAADFVAAGLRTGVRVVVGSEEKQTLEEVVGVEDETTVLAAMASEALGLPHNPVESVRAARDKHRMREILRAAHVPVPQFLRCSVAEDPMETARRVAYPCVLKPLF